MKIKANVEKTKDGYSAYFIHEPTNVSICSVADTFHGLKDKLKEAIELAAEEMDEKNKSVILNAKVELVLDTKSVFDLFPTLNLSGFADYIGMNRSLLNQYSKGIKKPSEKQAERIINGIRNLGKMYEEVTF